MIEARHFPRSHEALIALLTDLGGDRPSITVQAGHFLLYYDSVEDQVLPCISSELTSPRHALLREEVGAFPGLTWELALSFLEAQPHADRHIMVVVNDWQYLPEGVDRARFYERQQGLPVSYRPSYDRLQPAVALLTPPKASPTFPFFGEKNLRNRYRRLVEQLLQRGELPADVLVEQEGSDTVCNLPDILGRSMQIYCSNKSGDCAAEIAMMLRTAREETRCSLFVNFYPLVCREFVERGTELGERLFSNGIPVVVNVGLPSSGIRDESDLLAEAEVAVHRFQA